MDQNETTAIIEDEVIDRQHEYTAFAEHPDRFELNSGDADEILDQI